MEIVSGHGEVIDERGREFNSRTERDAPKGRSVRGDRSGTIPIPSECYSTRDDRLEPSSQRRTTEPTLLLNTPTNNYAADVRSSRDGFLLIVLPDRNLAAIGLDDALQHTCAGQYGVGSLLTADIACTFCQQVGRGSLYIDLLGESRSVLPYAPTPLDRCPSVRFELTFSH